MLLVSEPSDLTSLTSAAYAALVSASGPGVRNCVALSTRNGLASFTHAAGSHPSAPVGPTSGCHTPGTNVPSVQEIGMRPSWPSASIASAAIVPTSMPWFLSAPFGIPASDASYAAFSVPFPGNSVSSTRNAAVAAAASGEAFG